MIEPEMAGVQTARRAAKFWQNEWSGQSFMAIGAKDPVLGGEVMNDLRKTIRNCPKPMILEEAGHFVQEWGDQVAKAALKHFAGD